MNLTLSFIFTVNPIDLGESYELATEDVTGLTPYESLQKTNGFYSKDRKDVVPK